MNWRRNDPRVEKAAQLLYEKLMLPDQPPLPPGKKKPLWLTGGNSTVQEMCRSAVIDCSEMLFPTTPQEVMEKLALEAAVAKMGWPEINAFNEELRRGQDIREDAGGFFMRAIRRLFGLGTTKKTVQTYQSAANRMIERHLES